MRAFVKPFVAASLLLSLAGCATNKTQDLLDRTMIEYGNAIRWDGFEAAFQYVDPKLRAEHAYTDLDRARFKQVQVSEYDDGNGPIPDGKNQIRLNISLGITNIHTQGQRTINFKQVWHFDEATQHWWLESGIPNVDQPG